MINPDDRVIYYICENLIQSAAQSNLGRELTETELKRLPCIFVDDDTFNLTLYGALVEVARLAMNSGGWKQWDEMHKDVPLADF